MDYDILKDAENHAWWASLNRDIFAEWIFDRLIEMEVDGKDYKVEDYLTRYQVKEFWDASFDQIEEWSKEKYNRAQQNGLALWMAMGVVIGYISCAVRHGLQGH